MKNKKLEIIFLCCAFEATIVAFVAVANLFDNSIYNIFYNLFYGIGASVLFPLLILRKENATLETLGIKKLGARQTFVLASFVAFSVGGQIVPKVASGEMLRWNVLPVAILPLVMTTFFEEFLFRGFLQTRLEKQFGAVIAIIVSGLLFAVGIGFAFSFKLAENNLIVSYFVNLPNAFITYILKFEQFPRMTILSTIFAGITIILIVAILFAMKIKEMK